MQRTFKCAGKIFRNRVSNDQVTSFRYYLNLVKIFFVDKNFLATYVHQKVGYYQNKLSGIGKTCNDKPLDTKQNLGRFFRAHVARNVKREIIKFFK